MPEISIKAEELFRIGSFPVTNSFLLSFLALAVLLIIAFMIRRKLSVVPGKLQGIFELLFEQVLELMDSVLGSREVSERYLPLVLTIFLFVLTSNWLGIFPGIGPIGLKQGGHVVPLFRSPSADLNFTIALAVIAVISINVLGTAAIGIRKHASKFFNFSSPIAFFAGILEFISEFVKIVSFSFRLFGNVFAGEVLLTILAFLVPFILPLPFLFLEVFVGFIQAFIFSMLTLVFVGM